MQTLHSETYGTLRAVSSQDLFDAIDGQRLDRHPAALDGIEAALGARHQHRVVDGLFGGLDGRLKQRRGLIVGQILDLSDRGANGWRSAHAGRSGKADRVVARSVGERRAGAGKTGERAIAETA